MEDESFIVVSVRRVIKALFSHSAVHTTVRHVGGQGDVGHVAKLARALGKRGLKSEAMYFGRVPQTELL